MEDTPDSINFRLSLGLLGVKMAKMQRINEIPREKVLSDLLENNIKPTDNNYATCLEKHLCIEFGINLDSLFMPKLQSDCDKFAIQAVILWRKHHGREDRVLAKNRGKIEKCSVLKGIQTKVVNCQNKSKSIIVYVTYKLQSTIRFYLSYWFFYWHWQKRIEISYILFST